jgi:hypothetical protein
VLLDVRELGRAAEGFVVPVKVSHPPSRKKKVSHSGLLTRFFRYAQAGCQYSLVKIGVSAADVPNVALEVLHVDCVEADDGRVQTHVLLC